MPVYLIKPLGSGTWYGLHNLACASRPNTSLMVFCKEADARRWAHGMEAYKQRHGVYPSREYSRLPEAFSWVRRDGNHALDALEVVEMPFSHVMAMTKGSGVHCSILQDADRLRQKIEITQPFDRAAVCSKLDFNFAVSLDEHM